MTEFVNDFYNFSTSCQAFQWHSEHKMFSRLLFPNVAANIESSAIDWILVFFGSFFHLLESGPPIKCREKSDNSSGTCTSPFWISSTVTFSWITSWFAIHYFSPEVQSHVTYLRLIGWMYPIGLTNASELVFSIF